MRTIESRGAALAVGACMLLCASTAAAVDKICFNQFGHPALPGPPAIPGDPADPHWSTVYRFDYHNGTPIANGTLQVGSDSGQLYFQWTANNATGYANADRVILAFRDSTGNYRMIAIQPNCEGGGVPDHCDSMGARTCDPLQPACAKEKPLSTTYYTGVLNGNTVTWTDIGSVPAQLTTGARSTGTGQPSDDNSWAVQLKMPATLAGANGYTINSGAWKLYSDAFHVDVTNTPPTVTELTWPNNAGNVVYVSTLNLPPVANWGDAALGNAGCLGMHVTRAYTNGTTNGAPDPLKINFDRADMSVSADVTNSGAVDGTCVRATFRVANFGASDAWKPVPAPEAATQSIGAGASTTFTVSPWNVPADPDVGNYQAHPHQCIRVDLSVDSSTCTPSTSGNTFNNATFFQNMDFGHSSVFEREPAEVSGDHGPVPPGRGKNRYDLMVSRQPGKVESGARLMIMVHGVRYTGKFVELPAGLKPGSPDHGHGQEMKKYEVTLPIPSFGYVIDHELTPTEQQAWNNASNAQKVAAWSVDLKGMDPRTLPNGNVAPGLFKLDVSPRSVARVSPRVEYVGITGGPPGPICCAPTPTRKTTPIALGGVLLIGLFTYVRRRGPRV